MCLRGIVFYYTNNLTNAIKHFQEGLRCDPDHSQCRTMLKKARAFERTKADGNQAFSSGQSEEAIVQYSEALTIDPTNKSVNCVFHCNRAAAYMKLKQYQEALKDCDAAIELNQSYVKAYTRRGQCRQNLGDYEGSVRDYQRASEIDPNSEDVATELRNAKLELKKSKRKDLYKILEVPKTADEDEIKKAYKKQALKWHPDKHSSSEEARLQAEKTFKDVSEAYSILSDSTKRQRYDNGVEIEDLDNPMGGMGGGMHGMDPNDLFSMFFAEQGGFGGSPFGGGGGSPFGGGFHDFGGGHGGHPGTARGRRAHARQYR
jgi:DnaJ family protein C protein 7